MRVVLRFVAATLVLLAGFAPARVARAANLDTTADLVFGQADFVTSGANSPALAADSLASAYSMALDRQGNLYVADTGNNRVLEYDAPLTTHAAANRVFGQPNFITNTANSGSLGANSLNFPTGVALDAQGNLYVADYSNNRVLEYNAPLTTYQAANRVFGQPSFITNTANNSGVSANSLRGPYRLALDAQGNLYVSDQLNNRVLEYDTPLSTDAAADKVIGQANFMSNGLPFTLDAKSLNQPAGVALDAQGNLYVADNGNSRVLEYDGPLATYQAANRVFGQPNFASFYGNNGGLSANTLLFPAGVALDSQGNLYVADTGNKRLLEYDRPLASDAIADRVFGQNGSFTTNTSNNGGLSADSLYHPNGVALDAHDNLYAADYDNQRVLEYDTPVPYPAPTVAALSPSSVATGSPDFTLTVNGAGFVPSSSVRWNGADRPTTYQDSAQLSAAISAADLAGGSAFAVTVFSPGPGGGTSSLLNLTLYTRGGQDATADLEQGQPSFITNTLNSPLMPRANRLDLPNGVAVDARSGRLFVADECNNRVASWVNAQAQANGQAPDLVLGQPVTVADCSNPNPASARNLNNPLMVAVDALGNLYVADTGNNRVLEYNAPLSSGMAASHVFGQGGSFTSGMANNGGISANSLNGPFGMALDGAGNLYVADGSNNRVLEYDTPLSTNTTADRVFGQPVFITNTDNNGGPSATSLSFPQDVALDAQGNLYVADLFNNRVLEYNVPLLSDQTADRVFGQPDLTSSTANNGGLNADSLGQPNAVAVDGWGNLYVTDNGNQRVLEYIAPLTTDHTADRVFGQPDFGSSVSNNGGISANSVSGPRGLALDAAGNLYVADVYNNRVLEYDWALAKISLPLVRR